MSAEDWHGLCFHYGQGGHCGIECPAFNTSDCNSVGEIAEASGYEELYEYGFSWQELYDFGFKENMTANIGEIIGELKYQVLKQQTKYKFDPVLEIDKLFGATK